jgi:hypothetical protein
MAHWVDTFNKALHLTNKDAVEIIEKLINARLVQKEQMRLLKDFND